MNNDLQQQAKDAIDNLSMNIAKRCSGENALVVVVSCLEVIESVAYNYPKMRNVVIELYGTSTGFINEMPPEVSDEPEV